ncbi:NADPH-dependent F420 reductase [Sphingomonas sp.]|uniref:NADPH-dependent F420 reductase n=1 Tax=Sphingomonas sp. TaxID=28214 RepID=UPI003B0075FF
MRKTQVKIGFIGAGYVAKALATLAKEQGHEVMISNSRKPATLFATIYTLGVSGGTAEEAARFGDIVVLATPITAAGEIPVEPLEGKIVLDAQNYYPLRDGRIETFDRNETTTSELVARHLPKSRLVKAFSAITAADMTADALPTGSGDRRALPIAGDDEDAKKVVTEIHDAFGFDVVDAGPLSEGWRFEPETPTYCIRMGAEQLKAGLAATERLDVGKRQ